MSSKVLPRSGCAAAARANMKQVHAEQTELLRQKGNSNGILNIGKPSGGLQ